MPEPRPREDQPCPARAERLQSGSCEHRQRAGRRREPHPTRPIGARWADFPLSTGRPIWRPKSSSRISFGPSRWAWLRSAPRGSGNRNHPKIGQRCSPRSHQDPVTSREPQSGPDPTVPATSRESPGSFGAPSRRSSRGGPGAPPTSQIIPFLFLISVIESRSHEALGKARRLVRRDPRSRAPLLDHTEPRGTRGRRGTPAAVPRGIGEASKRAGVPRSIVRSSFFYIIVPERAFGRLS